MSQRRQTDGARRDRRLLALTGQAAYEWDIPSDAIAWGENFARLAGLAPGAPFSTGRDFEKLLRAEGSESRFGLVRSSEKTAKPGDIVSYQCVYAIAARHVQAGVPVWIEDLGAWQAGPDGRPLRAEGVVRVVSERRNVEETLRRRSDFDDLTGLPNRRYLQMKIDEALRACLEEGEQVAVLIIGLDRIDIVNECYGFPVGDEVIRAAGARIAARLRGADVVARFSGAKFGVILRNCTAREMNVAARRFLDAMQAEMADTSAGPVTLGASVGACLLPRHASSALEAVSVASAASKTARRHEGYRIHIHEPDAATLAERQAQAAFAARVAEACRTGALALAFQPVVEAATGSVAFHESLARMAAEPLACNSARSIVATAERLGFTAALDHTTLDLALRTLGEHPEISLSLNVSNETAEDPFWLSKLANGLNAVAGGGARLIVEITESHAAGDLAGTARFVSIVRSLGCRVAIDDFGAGYTSFASLKALPVDLIKIDGAYAGNLAADHANQVFIRSLIDIARACGARTVVEWVEDRETARLLTGWGVDYLQGHLFGEATLTPVWKNARPAIRKAG